MKGLIILIILGLFPQIFFSQDYEVSVHYGILKAKNYSTGNNIRGDNAQSIDYNMLEMLDGTTYYIYEVPKDEVSEQFYIGLLPLDRTKIDKIVSVEGALDGRAIYSAKSIKEVELEYLLKLLLAEKGLKQE